MPHLGRHLTHLELRNFRAFESEGIQLAPLTIFVGPNNSGKSSVLSALRLLAQTLQSADLDVPLLLGEFGTYRDVVFGNKSNRRVGLTVGFTYPGRGHASFAVNFKYRAQRREVILKDSAILDGNDKVLIKTMYSRGGKQVICELAGQDELRSAFMAKPVRNLHFLPRLAFLRFEVERKAGVATPSLGQAKTIVEIDRRSREASWLLQSVQYIGPFRDSPLRLYPFSGERPSVLSPTGRGATDILVADYFRRGSKKRKLSNQVRDWFINASIAKDLEIKAVSDRHYEIQFQHPVTGEFENLADVGYGISQILPVVIAGHNLESDSIFIVEQPEIHLHPRAQAESGPFSSGSIKEEFNASSRLTVNT